MEIRELTTDDLVSLGENRRSWQVGDYIQPMVYDGTDGPGLGHRVNMRVTDRMEIHDRFMYGRIHVQYRAVDRFGKEYMVWPGDDPRPSTEDEWNAEYSGDE